MERDSLHGQNQPLSLYKSHSLNPIMEEPPFVSRNFYSPSKGILRAPPFSLFHSAPFLLQPPPQPPLLPLSATLPRRSSSYPNPNPNFSPAVKNGARKTKPVKGFTKKNNIPKKEEKKAPKKSSHTLSISSSSNSGDFTAEQPKNQGSVSRFNPMIGKENSVIEEPGLVVFTISPPPSSLPLPTFSMRRKIGCKEVAAGIDAGATDDLRRLLRLL